MSAAAISEQVNGWLQALTGDDAPCGPDLEYDNAFLTLQQAAAGRPETQFQAAEPPDWRTVRKEAEALLARTRDLRVAMLWTRAVVQIDGLPGLVQGLALCLGLLQSFGDDLHPRPEDGDDYARANALALWGDGAALLADMRAATVVQVRGVGALRLRDFELVLNPAAALEGETQHSAESLQRMLSDAIAQGAEVVALTEAAQQAVKDLGRFLDERNSPNPSPDLKPARTLLHALAIQLPGQAPAPAEGAASDGAAAVVVGGVPTQGFSGGVASRADALRAIEAVCAYLERTEPTNPAQFMLRRAQRLLERNFLELVKELAPDALNEVARIMGVDPDQVASPSSGG